MGGCKSDEMTHITVEDVRKEGQLLVVKKPQRNNEAPREFAINAEMSRIVKKYQGLRSKRTTINRFFVNYQKGHCTCQPIGRNKFATIPREIAAWLKLKNPSSYTGHALRNIARTSSSNAAGAMINLNNLGAITSVAPGYAENLLRLVTQISNAEAASGNQESIFNESPKQKCPSPVHINVKGKPKQKCLSPVHINVKAEPVIESDDDLEEISKFSTKRSKRLRVSSPSDGISNSHLNSSENSSLCRNRLEHLVNPLQKERASSVSLPDSSVNPLQLSEVSSRSDLYMCNHCEIWFRNRVMHSVHMGYHGFKDPYSCNMCGEQFTDKVDFFEHIGHPKH